MAYSFYAAMGGLAIDTFDSGEAEYVRGSPQVTLTVEGILFLARLGHIHDISRASLQHRSKAGNLAKGLVCVQAGQAGESMYRAYSQVHLPVNYSM